MSQGRHRRARNGRLVSRWYARLARKGPMRTIDAAVLGTANGLATTARLVLTVALVLIVADTGAESTWVLVAEATAALALLFVLWRSLLSGGRASRASIVGKWILAAAGVAGLALIPEEVGAAFPLAAMGCMLAIGAGVAAAYIVQVNVLAEVDSPAEAAGQVKRWTLFSGVVSTVAMGVIAELAGWRWAVWMLAALLTLLALVHIGWRGWRAQDGDEARRSLRAVMSQSDDVFRDVKGAARTYGVWYVAPRLVALMGAGSLVVALLSGISRGGAWLTMSAVARKAGQLPGRVAAVGAAGGAACILVLVGAGPVVYWTVAGVALSLAEVGFTAVENSVRGRLAQGRDARRRQLALHMARFTAETAAGVLLAVAWWYLSRPSTPATVALTVGGLLAWSMRSVARRMARAALHWSGVELEARYPQSGGVLLVAVLPARETTWNRWAMVWAGRWELFRLERRGKLVCEVKHPERQRLFALGRPEWLLADAKRRAAWNDAMLPLTTLPNWHPFPLRLVDAGGVPFAEAVRFVDDRIHVEAGTSELGRLLPPLRTLLDADEKVRRLVEEDVDLTAAAHVALYRLRSRAFAGRLRVWSLRNETPERSVPPPRRAGAHRARPRRRVRRQMTPRPSTE